MKVYKSIFSYDISNAKELEYLFRRTEFNYINSIIKKIRKSSIRKDVKNKMIRAHKLRIINLTNINIYCIDKKIK